MGKIKRLREELEDKAAKVRNARVAVQAPDATERDRADLKLLEQDFVAEQQKVWRLSDAPSKEGDRRQPVKPSDRMDKKLDAALEDSFPSSDPVSFLEASEAPLGDQHRKGG